MTRRCIAALAALLIITGSALAGDPDIDFASMLLEEFGYEDLVVEYLQKITSDTKTPKSKRQSAHAALADVYMKLADQPTTGPSLREEYFAKAEKELGKVQELGGEQTGGHDLILRVAGILRDKALRTKAKADQDGVASEEKTRLYAQALESITEAIKRYQTVCDTKKKEIEKLEEGNVAEDELNDKKHQYGLAWFPLLRTKLVQGELSDATDKKRMVDALSDELDEFTTFFSEWGFEFYASLLKASVHKEAGNFEEAVNALDYLVEDLISRGITKQLPDVVQKAYLQKAQTLGEWAGVNKEKAMELGQKAMDTIVEFFKKNPKIARPKRKDVESMEMNAQFRTAEVVALMHMGQSDKALDLATEIFAKGTPRVRATITKYLQKLRDVEIAGVFIMKARRQLAQAQELMKLGRKDPPKKDQAVRAFKEAVETYRAFVKAATDRDMIVNGTTAWHHMGICYYFVEDYPSAAVAFGELARTARYVVEMSPEKSKEKERNKAMEMIETGLDLQTKCFSKIFKLTKEEVKKAKDAKDKKKYDLFIALADSDLTRWQESMVEFVESYEKSSKTVNMYYYIADSFRQQKKYEKSIEWYLKVPRRSKHFDDAQYMIPVAMWKEFEGIRDGEKAKVEELEKILDEIVKRFNQYMRQNQAQQKKAEAGKDEKQAKKLRDNASQAETIMAQAGIELLKIEAGKEQPDEKVIAARATGIIKALDGFEMKYPDKQSDTVIITRIQAWDKLDDFSSVEKAVDDLLAAKSRFAKDSVAIAANICIRMASSAADPADKAKGNRKAADYFEKLIAMDPDQSMDMIEWVGDQLFQMAEAMAHDAEKKENPAERTSAMDDAMELFKRAAGIYGRWLMNFEKNPKTSKDRTMTIYYKVFSCYMGMGDLEKAELYLKKLLEDPEWRKDWSIKEAQVKILHAKAVKMDEKEKEAGFTAVLQELAQNIRKLPQYEKEWWWCKVKAVEIYLDMGKYGVALYRIESTEEQFRWGSNERRREIADMMARYAEKLEEKKQKNRWNVVIELLRKPAEIPDMGVGEEKSEEPAEGEEKGAQGKGAKEKKAEPGKEGGANEVPQKKAPEKTAKENVPSEKKSGAGKASGTKPSAKEPVKREKKGKEEEKAEKGDKGAAGFVPAEVLWAAKNMNMPGIKCVKKTRASVQGAV